MNKMQMLDAITLLRAIKRMMQRMEREEVTPEMKKLIIEEITKVLQALGEEEN
jgi:hypothetical protein